MKTKILTAAIASVMASSVAMAEGHSNAVSSALANGTVSGEVYGGYTNVGIDSNVTDPEADTNISDFDLDILRLGYNTNISDSTELGIEVEWTLGDGPGQNSETRIRDLFVAKSINDNTTVTLGRFKQLADRNEAVEESDAIFTGSVSGPSTLQSIADFEETGEDLESDVANLARRIDGIEVKHANASGLNGTVSIYKGGNDTSGGDSDRQLSYAGSLGWQGGSDDLSFGATVALFKEDGGDTGQEADGYSLIVNGAMGPVVASLTYADRTQETNGAADVDYDSIGVAGAFNLGGASRSFDNYGVLQGPSVASGDMAYEIGFNYNSATVEEGAGEYDADDMGIVLNAYCGPNTKVYLSYTDQEWDFGAGGTAEFDQIALGARLDF
ncbi:porin [Pseudomonadales bacterium]|nr:porin [Pseudomonadales bacterium]